VNVIASSLLLVVLVQQPSYTYPATGEPAGSGHLIVGVSAGFPYSGVSVEAGLTPLLDVGVGLQTAALRVEREVVFARLRLAHFDRLSASIDVWGGGTQTSDLYWANTFTEEGPESVGADLLLGAYRREGGLALSGSVGMRLAINPYVLEYESDPARGVIVPGPGVAWAFPMLFNLELPATEQVSVHLSLGAELRRDFPNASFYVFPMPIIAAGVTWRS
jgi:hypothetical protein